MSLEQRCSIFPEYNYLESRVLLGRRTTGSQLIIVSRLESVRLGITQL